MSKNDPQICPSLDTLLLTKHIMTECHSYTELNTNSNVPGYLSEFLSHNIFSLAKQAVNYKNVHSVATY